MRMHFRPRLASDARAGAVLGAIFDAALESRYRQHRRPSRSGFLVLGVPHYLIDVSGGRQARHAASCGASARLSSGCERDQVEVPVLVWARENRNRPLRPTSPGAVGKGTDGSKRGAFVRVQLKFRRRPSPGPGAARRGRRGPRTSRLPRPSAHHRSRTRAPSPHQ